MLLQSLMHITANRDGVLSRRTFLRGVGFGTAAGMLGWKEAVALHAEELRRRDMACILLFMRGGPSQFETFNPKPGEATGGPTQAISTAVSGIQIAEGWTNVARAMGDIALIRSMTSREGEHQRATYQMHTGYVPAGSVRYPTFGSTVACEIAPREFDLPHFVSIGNRQSTPGPGFLPMTYAPFIVTNPSQMPNNAELPRGVGSERLSRRLGLLAELEEDFTRAGGKPQVERHSALTDSAARMVRSPRLRAFDLSQENDSVRDRYGRNSFGQACLLARRLVEAGVTFVEVELTGWDTHQDNFNRVHRLTAQADPAFAALVNDLKDRGRLERTLVIWIGEFGRTPRINPRTGRDHFPRAFNVALAGGGIRGGRAIGATSATGTEVTSQPVTVPDLFCTFCQALGINPRKENMTPLGRPIRIVTGGEPIRELFT
jgi:Protein of unknown function (DUF1501)